MEVNYYDMVALLFVITKKHTGHWVALSGKIKLGLCLGWYGHFDGIVQKHIHKRLI